MRASGAAASTAAGTTAAPERVDDDRGPVPTARLAQPLGEAVAVEGDDLVRTEVAETLEPLAVAPRTDDALRPENARGLECDRADGARGTEDEHAVFRANRGSRRHRDPARDAGDPARRPESVVEPVWDCDRDGARGNPCARRGTRPSSSLARRRRRTPASRLGGPPPRSPGCTGVAGARRRTARRRRRGRAGSARRRRPRPARPRRSPRQGAGCRARRPARRARAHPTTARRRFSGRGAWARSTPSRARRRFRRSR